MKSATQLIRYATLCIHPCSIYAVGENQYFKGSMTVCLHQSYLRINQMVLCHKDFCVQVTSFVLL